MLDAYNRYLNEQRTIAYFTLPASAAGTVEAPSEEALKSFYEDHKMQFMAPEFRKVAVLAVTPQTVAAKIVIPDEEVKALYDAKPGNYAVPERRKVEIIPFKSKEAAEAAETQLTGGKSFADVAKAAGFQTGDISLGSVSKKELGEKFSANDAIARRGFQPQEGQVQPAHRRAAFLGDRARGRDRARQGGKFRRGEGWHPREHGQDEERRRILQARQIA